MARVTWVHRLRHRLGLFYGTVESFLIGGHIVIGFQCAHCGRLSGVHRATLSLDERYGPNAEK